MLQHNAEVVGLSPGFIFPHATKKGYLGEDSSSSSVRLEWWKRLRCVCAFCVHDIKSNLLRKKKSHDAPQISV